MAVGYRPTTLVQCVSVAPFLTLPGETEPGGCHDLTLGRIYEMIALEANGKLVRINDDSGDDFLYPAGHFRVL
jgi:hypothetical protein